MSTAALSLRLTELGQCDESLFPPAEAALWLAARDQPDALAALPARLAQIETLAGQLRDAVTAAAPLASQTAALAALLGSAPDPEADPADFGRVVETGRGEPDALALLLLEVAARAGLRLEPLTFPGPLLLRLENLDGQRVIFSADAPLHPLTPLDLRALLKAARGLSEELQPAYFTPLAARAALARMRNGLKARLLRQGQIDQALILIEDLLRVVPDQPSLWREAGLMHLRRGARDHALAALQQFVLRTPDTEARARILSLMAEVRSRPF